MSTHRIDRLEESTQSDRHFVTYMQKDNRFLWVMNEEGEKSDVQAKEHDVNCVTPVSSAAGNVGCRAKIS